MPQFDDREKAQEAKFARDGELRFKAEARRNKLLGLWAAEQMGLSESHAKDYAAEVVASDFEEAGDEDVIRKVLGDLTGAGCDLDEAAVRAALDEKSVEAKRQLMSES